MSENETCSGVSTIKFKSCKTGCETCAVDTETKIYYKDGAPFKVIIQQLWDRTKYRFYPNSKRLETEIDFVAENPDTPFLSDNNDRKIILEYLSAAAEAVKDNNKPEFVKQTIEDIKKQITDLKIKRNTGFTHEGV